MRHCCRVGCATSRWILTLMAAMHSDRRCLAQMTTRRSWCLHRRPPLEPTDRTTMAPPAAHRVLRHLPAPVPRLHQPQQRSWTPCSPTQVATDPAHRSSSGGRPRRCRWQTTCHGSWWRGTRIKGQKITALASHGDTGVTASTPRTLPTVLKPIARRGSPQWDGMSALSRFTCGPSAHLCLLRCVGAPVWTCTVG